MKAVAARYVAAFIPKTPPGDGAMPSSPNFSGSYRLDNGAEGGRILESCLKLIGKNMKLQDLHGMPGFILYGISFGRLCGCIAKLPGVTFTDRRRFFWWAGNVKAEFTFQNCAFTILPDDWENALWVEPKDEQTSSSTIQELRAHLVQLGATPTKQ